LFQSFVRPSANGGTFGGLSAYTHDVVSLCQAADYRLVLVETVGLGQSEVEVAESVDMLLLVVPPGGGDELQGVKKGIVEVADMLLVTKADGNLLAAANSTAAEYKSAMKFQRQRYQNWGPPPVILTSAVTGDGIDKVWKEICKFRSAMIETNELQRKRQRQAKYWMWKNLQNLITAKTKEDAQLQKAAHDMELALLDGTITPRVAAAELLDSLLKHSSPS
jgi:LAO/AO transport system kinase